MIGTETGIIGHLRAGGSRNADARSPTVCSGGGPTPISSFLRRRSSAAQTKFPPVKAAGPRRISYKAPSLETLGLQSPLLGAQPSLSLATSSSSTQSKFSWMNKSFLSNLRGLLEDSEEIRGVMKEAVSWNSNGDAFTVRDKALFATHLAPKYFSIMSVSTFRMVAQSWGFTLQVDPSTGAETYQHARFLRDDPSKCHGATMQEMKDSSAQPPLPPPSHMESNDSKKQEKVKDPLLLLAATASASSNPSTEESTSKATEENQTDAKEQLVSMKPSFVPSRRTSLSSVLCASRKTTLGFKMPPGNPLHRSMDQTMTASDATSATLELLKSSRNKTFDKVVLPSFSGLRMPPRGVGPNNPLVSSKIGNSSLDELEKRVRLLKAQASLAASIHLLDEPTLPNFGVLDNLRAILEQAEQDRFTHIASWMKHGRSFRIYHENEFTQVVYPRLTNGSPLTDVDKILKEYGFIKLAKGREKEAYFHPLFVRDLPMLGRGKTIQQWKAAGWKGDSTPEFFL